MTHRLRCAAIAAALLVVAPAAQAAPEWNVTPYLWAAGFDGTVGTAGGNAGIGDRVSLEFNKFEDNLKLGGFMLNGSWRDGRWTAYGDWTYAKVESDSSTRVPNLYGSVNGQIKGNIIQGNVGYDFGAGGPSHLDLYGGIRYYDLDIRIGLTGGALPGTDLSGDAKWTDGVVGVKWSTQFAENWTGLVQADVGAGGSNLSWQAIGAVGYRFNWGSIVGGWRYLKVDYDDGPYVLDAALTGPFIGASFRF